MALPRGAPGSVPSRPTPAASPFTRQQYLGAHSSEWGLNSTSGTYLYECLQVEACLELSSDHHPAMQTRVIRDIDLAGAKSPTRVPTTLTRGQGLIFPGSKPFKQEQRSSSRGQGPALGNLMVTLSKSRSGSRGDLHPRIPANASSAKAHGKDKKSGITAAPGLDRLSDALTSPKEARGQCWQMPAEVVEEA